MLVLWIALHLCALQVGAAPMSFRPQFVTFGDSITQRGFAPGWSSALADAYQRRVDVINRGYSGYNSRWALQLLPRIFPLPPANGGAAGAEAGVVPPPPALVTVWFGANDAALPDRGSARQHVPLDEYRSNLVAIANHLATAGVPAVVLITTPPVSEPDRLVHVEKTYGVKLAVPERTNEVAGQYAAAVESVAAQLGLPCLNLWAAFQRVPGWQQKLLCDGLHLTPEGNDEVYRLLQELIDERVPQLRIKAIKFDAPDHSLIDPQDVPAAFDTYFAKKQQRAASPAGSKDEL